MIDRQPLGFSDYQLEMLRRALATLPPDRRDEFLTSLVRRLAPQPSDAAVSWAINKTLDLIPSDGAVL